MREMNRARLLLFMFVIAMSGCFRPSFQPSGIAEPDSVAKNVCIQINANRPLITSLRALADATITSSSEAASFRYVVVSQDPASLRVDVLPINAAFTLGLLVAHNGRAVWLNSQDRTYAIDANERVLISEFLGLRGVSRETAIALVSGIVPKLNCSDLRIFKADTNDRLLIDDRAHIAWRVRGESADLIGVQILDAGGSRIEAQAAFKGSRGVGRVIELEIFSPVRATIEISLAQLIYNPMLNERLFKIEPPSGYSQIDVS